MAEGLQQRNLGKQKASNQETPLDKLKDDASAEPLDEQEQEAIIASLRASNDKSNYVFRALLLVVFTLVGILYLTPVPDYLTGKHPESHLTLFFNATHLGPGTHDDLLHLPAWPVYLFLLGIQGACLFGGAYETMDRLGLLRSTGKAFPHQPHQFGTAPDFVVPLLSDIRWHPSHMGKRADDPDYQAPTVMSTMSPRVLYLCFLTVVSSPVPLMTFGAGSFANSGWWAITTAALAILSLCEGMMDKFEREAVGLNGMKYSYKGA